MKTPLLPKILIPFIVIMSLGAILSTRPLERSYMLAPPALGPTETATATITPTLTLTPTITSTPTVTVTLTFITDTYLPAMQLQPTPQPTATPACLPSPPIDPDDAVVEADTRFRINEQRNLNGVGALVAAAELIQSSRRHSLDMALNHFIGHTGSDGSSPGDRVREACYDWDFVGEIIGWGFGGDTSAMVNWWMNSAPHRAAILSTTYQEFGAGYMRRPGSDWVHYWTVNFGRRDPGLQFPTSELHLCQYTSIGEQGGSSLIFLSTEPCPLYE